MTGLPPGRVALYDVMEWAQEQAQFLSPTQAYVLWYLCLNAWRDDDNPERQDVGTVMSGRVAQRKIQMRTGLSRRAVQNALAALQEAAYIVASHQPGRGKSDIVVFWQESDDEFRAELRAGVRDLPAAFKRPKKSKETVKLAPVVDFNKAHEVRQ